jgi:hypothetical protein
MKLEYYAEIINAESGEKRILQLASGKPMPVPFRRKDGEYKIVREMRRIAHTSLLSRAKHINANGELVATAYTADEVHGRTDEQARASEAVEGARRLKNNNDQFITVGVIAVVEKDFEVEHQQRLAALAAATATSAAAAAQNPNPSPAPFGVTVDRKMASELQVIIANSAAAAPHASQTGTVSPTPTPTPTAAAHSQNNATHSEAMNAPLHVVVRVKPPMMGVPPTPTPTPTAASAAAAAAAGSFESPLAARFVQSSDLLQATLQPTLQPQPSPQQPLLQLLPLQAALASTAAASASTVLGAAPSEAAPATVKENPKNEIVHSHALSK